MRPTLILTLTLTLVACGGASNEPASGGSSGSESPDGSEVCEGYTPTDACMNGDNFAECQRVAEQCPGEVQVMESCPLQFGCPTGSSDSTTAAPCNGHNLGDSCVDEAAFAQCQEMVAQCPGVVREAETCPIQFSCP